MPWALGLIQIMGFPASILLAFATGCIAQPRGFQAVLSAKLRQVMHGVLSPIGGEKQGCSCIGWGMSKRGLTLLFTCCKAVLLACTRFRLLAFCFFACLSA